MPELTQAIPSQKEHNADAVEAGVRRWPNRRSGHIHAFNISPAYDSYATYQPQRAKALESGRKLLNTEIHKARRRLLHSLDVKLSGSASIALTCANDKLTHGAGGSF